MGLSQSNNQIHYTLYRSGGVGYTYWVKNIYGTVRITNMYTIVVAQLLPDIKFVVNRLLLESFRALQPAGQRNILSPIGPSRCYKFVRSKRYTVSPPKFHQRQKFGTGND